MVVGPLTGTEIDFPNTPADLEEFHAPNRFVYEWKDDNRWRNIHRPLILPDYIWPPLDIPADPNVDPTGVLPGETGDDGYPGDWKLQALIFPVPSLEANVRVDLLMRSENGGDDPYGTFNHALWDDDFNNAAANENEYHVNNDQKFIIYDNILRSSHETRVKNAPFSDAGIWPPSQLGTSVPADKLAFPRSGDISDFSARFVVSATDLLNVLPQPEFRDSVAVRWKFSVKGIHPSGAGGSETAVLDWANDSGVVFNVGGALDFPPVGFTDVKDIDDPLFTYTSDYLMIPAGCRYLVMNVKFGAGTEFGEASLEFIDPNSPANRDIPPVAFACDEGLQYSYVAFESPLTGVGYIRTIRHGNPGQLDNSFYTDYTLYGEQMLDINGNPATYTFGPAMYMRDDGNFFCFTNGLSNTVEGRFLSSPFDLSTLNNIEDSATLYWDYRNDSAESPGLGVGGIQDVDFNPDGDKMFVMDLSGNIIVFPLLTPWDVSTADLGNSYTLILSAFAGTKFTLASGGHVLVLLKENFMKQIILDTAYDLTTAIDTGYEREFYLSDPKDIYISRDGMTILVLDIPELLTEGYAIYRYYRELE